MTGALLSIRELMLLGWPDAPCPWCDARHEGRSCMSGSVSLACPWCQERQVVHNWLPSFVRGRLGLYCENHACEIRDFGVDTIDGPLTAREYGRWEPTGCGPRVLSGDDATVIAGLMTKAPGPSDAEQQGTTDTADQCHDSELPCREVRI